ncbi:MAG: tRNA-intron lyase [Candidatus Heimdallarchaeota archaeon]|nr:tRNA-intron lyase [Candidatus Heimdallarchaeota archaeon]MDH5647687.1 tRNA-intron lyase [Candidatus Heimdallarchaeota archaeon]
MDIPIFELESDTIIVWDERIGSILYELGFFGKPLGLRKANPGKLQRPLVLSMFDALYLSKKNIIKISYNGNLLDENEFLQVADELYVDFSSKYQVYEHLRNMGYVVRPGMKFGSDFAIYEEGPGKDHSIAVVHVVNDSVNLKAIEIVRAGRLAASVKKNYLIATISNDNNPIFYGFDRVKI